MECIYFICLEMILISPCYVCVTVSGVLQRLTWPIRTDWFRRFRTIDAFWTETFDHARSCIVYMLQLIIFAVHIHSIQGCLRAVRNRANSKLKIGPNIRYSLCKCEQFSFCLFCFIFDEMSLGLCLVFRLFISIYRYIVFEKSKFHSVFGLPFWIWEAH